MNIVHQQEIRASSPRKPLRGWLCTLDTGDKVYLAARRHRELFRKRHPTISDAMRAGDCGWAIDEVTCISMRAKGVKVMGVRCTDTHDLYLTPIESFFDRKIFSIIDYTGVGRGGSRQRVVTIQHFEIQKGAVDLMPTSLKGK